MSEAQKSDTAVTEDINNDIEASSQDTQTPQLPTSQPRDQSSLSNSLQTDGAPRGVQTELKKSLTKSNGKSESSIDEGADQTKDKLESTQDASVIRNPNGTIEQALEAKKLSGSSSKETVVSASSRLFTSNLDSQTRTKNDSPESKHVEKRDMGQVDSIGVHEQRGSQSIAHNSSPSQIVEGADMLQDLTSLDQARAEFGIAVKSQSTDSQMRKLISEENFSRNEKTEDQESGQRAREIVNNHETINLDSKMEQDSQLGEDSNFQVPKAEQLKLEIGAGEQSANAQVNHEGGVLSAEIVSAAEGNAIPEAIEPKAERIEKPKTLSKIDLHHSQSAESCLSSEPNQAQTDMHDLNNFFASVIQEDEDDLFQSLSQEEEELRSASTADVVIDTSKFADFLQRSKDRLKEKRSDAQRLMQFEELTQDQKMKISSVPKEQVAARLALIRQRQRENRDKVHQYFESREADIISREKDARDRVIQLQFEREHKVEAVRDAISANLANLEPKLRRAFMRREEHLRRTLAKQDAQIREEFGVLHEDNSYSARKLIIDTSHKVPQKVALRIDVLRGVKDKLPRGKYRVGIYVLDELAGTRLVHFDANKEGKTAPEKGTIENELSWSRQFDHKGRFDSFEASVHDSVVIICPPRRHIARSNVFVLEIFRCSDRDPSKVQSIVGWSVLPMINAEGNLCQGQFKLPVLKGAYSASFDRYFKIEKAMSHDIDCWLCNAYIHVEPVSRLLSKSNGSRLSHDDDLKVTMEMDFSHNFEDMQANEVLHGDNGGNDNNIEVSVPKSWLSRLAHAFTRHPWSSGKNIPGVNPVSDSIKARERAKRAESFTKPSMRDLEDYTYALHAAPVSRKAAILHQLGYLGQELQNGLRLRRMRVNEGWMSLFLIVSAFYLRMFAHYGGQYLYLRSGGYGAAYLFQVLPYKCVIKFSDTSMPLYPLANMMFVGTFSVLCLFAFVGGVSFSIQVLLGGMPSLMHKLVMMVGIMALFDPIITVFVDGCAGQVSCDSYCDAGKHARDCFCSDTDVWRIINYFYVHEGSVLNAAYLLILMYAIMLGISLLVVSLYMVFIHRDGRSHDLYRRLFGATGDFFIPDDTEVSSTYVQTVWHRAVQWKGPRGATRTVSTSSHSDRTELEVTQIEKDGTKFLWRVFTQLSNGIIVEEAREK